MHSKPTMNPTSSLDPSIQAAIGAMESSMQQFFHHLPNPFQRLIIPKILRMMKKRIQPRPILLVQGTGGGKSAVPQNMWMYKSWYYHYIGKYTGTGS